VGILYVDFRMSHLEREFPRYATEAEVRLKGSAEVVGTTRDLSMGGLCALAAGVLGVGEIVSVELTLIFEEDATSEPLTLQARVVWCTVVDEMSQIGLAFVGLKNDQKSYLEMFLRFLVDDEDEDEGDDEVVEEDDDDPFA
jgi:hypothetical protein